MTATELEPLTFLTKVRELARQQAGRPVQLSVLRREVVEPVLVGNRVENQEGILIRYGLRAGEAEEFTTREFAPYDARGEADLSPLPVWSAVSTRLPGRASPTDQRLPGTVQPTLVHRSGSF